MCTNGVELGGGAKVDWFRRELPKWLFFRRLLHAAPSLFISPAHVSRLLRIKNQRYMKRTNSTHFFSEATTGTRFFVRAYCTGLAERGGRDERMCFGGVVWFVLVLVLVC